MRFLSLFILFSACINANAQELSCYDKCLGQGRTTQLCSSLCRSSQAQSIQIRPINPQATSNVSQQGPLAGANSPEALRAKCTIQRDVNACRQLQEVLAGGTENTPSTGNFRNALPASQTQQFNQRLQDKNIPESMRTKCLVEFNLGVCKEIDEVLNGKKTLPTEPK